MAELAKKLNFKKDGMQQTAKAYSTTAEVGEHWVNAKIDGVPAYVAIGDIADSRATSGRVKGSGGDSYAILNSGKPPYNKVEYRTPGTYTITFAAGVTTAKITLAGAGGGGGGGGYIHQENTYNGGAGGNGELIIEKLNVIPLTTYTIIVGGGGAGGAMSPEKNYRVNAYPGQDGNNSSFANLEARGGGGGGGYYLPSQGSTTGHAGTPGNTAGNGEGGVGGKGGLSSLSRTSGASGANGWVIIEYGGDI